MRMSEIDMEKEAALIEAQNAWMEAYTVYSTYLDKHDINRRSLDEIREAARLESICGMAKMRYEQVKSQRYRV